MSIDQEIALAELRLGVALPALWQRCLRSADIFETLMAMPRLFFAPADLRPLSEDSELTEHAEPAWVYPAERRSAANRHDVIPFADIGGQVFGFVYGGDGEPEIVSLVRNQDVGLHRPKVWPTFGRWYQDVMASLILQLPKDFALETDVPRVTELLGRWSPDVAPGYRLAPADVHGKLRHHIRGDGIDVSVIRGWNGGLVPEATDFASGAHFFHALTPTGDTMFVLAAEDGGELMDLAHKYVPGTQEVVLAMGSPNRVMVGNARCRSRKPGARIELSTATVWEVLSLLAPRQIPGGGVIEIEEISWQPGNHAAVNFRRGTTNMRARFSLRGGEPDELSRRSGGAYCVTALVELLELSAERDDEDDILVLEELVDFDLDEFPDSLAAMEAAPEPPDRDVEFAETLADVQSPL